MNAKFILMLIIVIPLLGSFIGFVIGKVSEKVRDIFNIIMTGTVFILTTLMFPSVEMGRIDLEIPNIMGIGLQLKMDMFRYIFVWLTTFIWFLVTIYSTQYLISYKNRNRYYLFFMLTYWSTIGIFISENFLNLFTFFEIMSLASYPLIIHDEDKYCHEAGETYIIMAVTGGLVLLMGLFLLYDYAQTLEITQLKIAVKNIGQIKYLITALIVFGFGVKAGMVPLHIWLPKAHPAAPAPASAILSGILLKTGIFGIMVTSQIMVPGDHKVSNTILVLGFITMFVGGFLAMFQRNIKRILAYSSMSQMGYILVGIGLTGILGNYKAVALYGTLYHIINHVIFKVLLFMAAGVIYMALHELSINSIGGFGINKKLLKVLFFIGLCGIIGMPGFNGFISKNLLHHALAEATHIYGGVWFTIGEIIFVISSGFTTAYLLKIFIAVFVEKSDHQVNKEKTKINYKALFPMTVLATLTIYIGINPKFIVGILDKAVSPFNVYSSIEAHFYTFENLKSSFISIGLGAFFYIVFIRKVLKKGSGENWWYENIALNWFSIEKNIYKPTLSFIFKSSSFILKVFDEGLIRSINYINDFFQALGKKQIVLNKNVKININIKDRIVPINKKIAVGKSLNEEISKAGYRMNSITYSIYIFGVVLLVLLIALVY
ncbi:formate hydrogenlyase subunit 3/multisubunit Na+/H+ antiporter MnhD subunit [Clostridium tetanomorphum]|uniref:Sodium:proton antiporter n=1 Tax=Clostridium tetanomorphum TaxID=1553 RepID=A0A923J256_CLOTT|nr:proton-conducting transporter membrane subunit [Clostridium tetanomorphum]KAJ52479.1 sodium/proton antiporter shaA [Clostridium tetanomorphum DSM 665]MBC2399489.1 sodium:proton antiporter [Clostridium tetanomorphum]MBP1864158.1 formate hydrogenlyase subunit 3/multisubunit Na+/H+ antiporter MnhD subunit [Clostridium tetanomorphum]NRS84571.1 formate hydrogenlyase subunit 3/multisubunit Na+/H+ antiporter MnhD subunit [Clostridium tetanomorphum]NRZ97785.1 formate hydrogenlyase subunit 3/multisu